MSGKFLTDARHGTTFHFLRRIPAYAQSRIRKAFLLRSLQTSNLRLARTRGRALPAKQKCKKNGLADETKLGYGRRIDFGRDGGLPT